jgi:hypothetical protein
MVVWITYAKRAMQDLMITSDLSGEFGCRSPMLGPRAAVRTDAPWAAAFEAPVGRGRDLGGTGLAPDAVERGRAVVGSPERETARGRSAALRGAREEAAGQIAQAARTRWSLRARCPPI